MFARPLAPMVGALPFAKGIDSKYFWSVANGTTSTGDFNFGNITDGRATRISFSFNSAFIALKWHKCSMMIGFHKSLLYSLTAVMLTGLEFLTLSFRKKRIIVRKDLFIKEVLTSLSSANSSSRPIHTSSFGAPRCTWSSMTSYFSDCLFVLRNRRTIRRWLQFCHDGGPIDFGTRLGHAPVFSWNMVRTWIFRVIRKASFSLRVLWRDITILALPFM